MKSVFTKNTNLSRTIITQDEPLYKELAHFTLKINNLLILFSEGRFSEVSKLLTREKYIILAKKLISLKDRNPIYEQFRKTITRSLEGLYQGVLQNVLLINTEYKLTKESEKASILDDMDRMLEYMKTLKESLNILPDQEITVTTVQIKPEYLEYIKLYGYPIGGVFEVDKLAPLKKTGCD